MRPTTEALRTLVNRMRRPFDVEMSVHLAHRVACAVLIATVTPLFAAPHVHSVPDTIAQRVQACTARHGKEGVSTREGYVPRIACKAAGYLYNQRLNFRDGRRSNAAMAVLIDNLTDAYLLEVAGHFASLDLPYQAPPNRATTAQELERGEFLVKQGDVSLRLPACVLCHGVALTGAAPSIPSLVGLSKDYLQAQLGVWRAHSPDCMGEISRRLSYPDLSAVATYLSRLPVPRESMPATFLPKPLPLVVSRSATQLTNGSALRSAG